jgi:upstream activation factor subunit UAF30
MNIVTADEEHEYAGIIDDILTHSDLNTVSAKAIRKGIQKQVDHDISAKKVTAIEV